MATKDSAPMARKYLKIIGTVAAVLSFLGVITGILVACGVIKDLNQFGDMQSLRDNGASDDQIRVILGVGSIIASLIGVWAGFVIRNASKKGGKTTLALVLTVLNIVGGVTTITSDVKMDTKISNVVMLTIYILALLAIFKVRKANEED